MKLEKIHLKDYIDYRYNESLNEVVILNEDSEETKQKRKSNLRRFRQWF